MMGSVESPLTSATIITYSFAAFGDTFYEKILRAMIEEGQRRGLALDVNLLMLRPSTMEIPDASLFQNGVPLWIGSPLSVVLRSWSTASTR